MVRGESKASFQRTTERGERRRDTHLSNVRYHLRFLKSKTLAEIRKEMPIHERAVRITHRTEAKQYTHLTQCTNLGAKPCAKELVERNDHPADSPIISRHYNLHSDYAENNLRPHSSQT